MRLVKDVARTADTEIQTVEVGKRKGKIALRAKAQMGE